MRPGPHHREGQSVNDPLWKDFNQTITYGELLREAGHAIDLMNAYAIAHQHEGTIPAERAQTMTKLLVAWHALRDASTDRFDETAPEEVAEVALNLTRRIALTLSKNQPLAHNL